MLIDKPFAVGGSFSATVWRYTTDFIEAMRRALVGRTKAAIVPFSASGTLVITNPCTHVRVSTAAGNVVITLPPALGLEGQLVYVKKLTAPNTLTVAAAGIDTLDGAATIVWTTQYQSYLFVSNGSGWDIV